jgi:hypothetical protein
LAHREETPDPRLTDFGPPYGYTVGAKYDSSLDIVAIAKLVRAEIKASIKAGTLPALKTSVKISRYSMGQSLDVTIMDCPADVVSDEYAAFDLAHGINVYNRHPFLNQVGKNIQERLQAICDQYNYDRSDSQTDYFDVNFGGRVTWDWNWKRSKLEDKKEAMQRGLAPALASQSVDTRLSPVLSR